MKTGVQMICNNLKRLDSGFCRNDKKVVFRLFTSSSILPAPLNLFNLVTSPPVLFPAVITDGDSILQIKLMAAFAHPAGNLGRIAQHKGVIRHVFGHHSACADKGVSPYGVAAYDRCIGAYGCALFDQGFLEFVFSGNMTSGIDPLDRPGPQS